MSKKRTPPKSKSRHVADVATPSPSGGPLRLEYVEAGTLRGKENPSNWRRHPEKQANAMRQVLDQVGWAGALLFNEQTGKLLNGHMRLANVKDGDVVPVLIGSWSPENEKIILLTHDSITSMAEADDAQLRLLQTEVDLKSRSLGDVDLHLAAMLTESDRETVLKEIPVQRPPALTWILIGIPTVRYGEINTEVERIAKLDGVTCELSVGDATPAKPAKASADG